MAYYRWQTVKRTRKSHHCYGCSRLILAGSTCTYGFTTDREVNLNGVSYGHFCTECRDPAKNVKEVEKDVE